MKKYMVNVTRFFVAAFTSLAGLLLGGTMIYLGQIIPGLVLLLIFVAFLIASTYSGAHVSADSEGVTRHGLFGGKTTMAWQDIKEVGVAGSRIFNKGEKHKPGTLYIYFSGKEMTDDERFEMMLKWPPKDKIYIEYTDEIGRQVLQLWEKPFVEYNTCDAPIVK